MDFHRVNTWSDQHSDQGTAHDPKRPKCPLSVIPCSLEYPLSWLLTPQINSDCFITLYEWNHSIHTILCLAIFFSKLCLWIHLLHVLIVYSFSLYTVLVSLISLFKEHITLYSFCYWWTFEFFKFETIVNFADINILLHAFWWTHVLFLLDLYVRVEWLSHRLAFIQI